MLREAIVAKAKEKLGTPYSSLDCSAFVRWVFRNFGIELPRVSAEQGRYVYNKGLATEISIENKADDVIKKLNVGDLLWWKNDKYVTRWRRIHHVAIYIGNGQIIESAGEGVRIKNLWETSVWQVILIADITSILVYDEPEAPAESEEDMIQKGQKGEIVKEWQKALLSVNPEALPRYGADGDFGNETEAATKAFQKPVYLAETGIVDMATQASMFKALREIGQDALVIAGQVPTLEGTVVDLNNKIAQAIDILK